MEFTLKFAQLFFYGLGLAAPLLVSLVVIITVLAQIVGAREKWSRFDSLYWGFITATTVGYGDLRPVRHLSKILSVLIALTGMIFTGILIALAINAATITFKSISALDGIKENIEKIL